MASFKSNIKKVYTALSKLPGVIPFYDDLGFPISTERQQAYMLFRVECPEDQNPLRIFYEEPDVDYTASDVAQAKRKAQTYINKAAVNIRKALGIDNSYKFRDVSSKIRTLQRGMIYPDWRKRLAYYINNERWSEFDQNRDTLFALLNVPTEIGTINWYIRYSGCYQRSCAEFYIEVFGSAIKDNSNAVFTIAPDIKVGTILTSTWGYSMTIVDFYKVVKRTNSFVYVKQLKRETVKDDGPAGSTVRPLDEFEDSTIYRSKISLGKNSQLFKDGWYIKAPKNHGLLNVWDGTDQYENRWD